MKLLLLLAQDTMNKKANLNKENKLSLSNLRTFYRKQLGLQMRRSDKPSRLRVQQLILNNKRFGLSAATICISQKPDLKRNICP